MYIYNIYKKNIIYFKFKIFKSVILYLLSILTNDNFKFKYH